jgi:hypothetical protein
VTVHPRRRPEGNGQRLTRTSAAGLLRRSPIPESASLRARRASFEPASIRREVELRNRWSLGWDYYDELQVFEKDFRNRSNRFSVGYNTREFQSASLAYTFGRNFDSDLDVWQLQLRRKLGESLSLEYELTTLRLVPDPENESTDITSSAASTIHPDRSKRSSSRAAPSIARTCRRCSWRYRPPFGTVQVAYERGTAPSANARAGQSLFLKFSYVF